VTARRDHREQARPDRSGGNGQDRDPVASWIQRGRSGRSCDGRVGVPADISPDFRKELDDLAARFRFINYVRWESAEPWRSAHDDGFRALLSQPE
jgi:hypothetical protein